MNKDMYSVFRDKVKILEREFKKRFGDKDYTVNITMWNDEDFQIILWYSTGNRLIHRLSLSSDNSDILYSKEKI